MNSEQFNYDGKLGELYKIFLVNLFLGLITLGIYHFWGKTRMHRYMTSSLSLHGDRFEYTGTGGQLFRGFLKAIVLIIIFSLPLFWAFHEMAQLDDKYQLSQTSQSTNIDNVDAMSHEDLKQYAIAVGVVFAYLIFYYLFLPFVAIFGSLRYRACNTRWRSIRGQMGGSTLKYAFYGLMHVFLVIVTLGIWMPSFDLMLHRYKMKRMSFGDQPFQFNAQFGKLYFTHMMCILISAVIAGAAGLIAQRIEAVPAVFIASLILSRFWYRAHLARLKYQGLTIGPIGFTSTMTGFNLFRLQVVNWAILICTLGLGLPIIKQRRMHFFCQHVKPMGAIEGTTFNQASGEIDRKGEGVSSALDIEIGLF